MSTIAKYTLLVLIFLAGGVSDQLSKSWVAHNLKNKPVLVIVDNVLELGYTENRGMVFGINNRNNTGKSRNLLLIVRILMSIGLIIYIIFNKKQTVLSLVPFLLILAGAVGNVIDSIRLGYVIDFIHMHAGSFLDWPFLYNLADAYVVIGMVLLILQSFISDRKKGTVARS